MALVEECHRAGLSSPSLVSCCAGALPMMDPSWPSKAAGSPCSSAMLKPAFTVMGRPAARATSCRGGRSRLLGRCFTVSAQTGDVSLVTLALQCRADIEQRINGQSALDSASQAGQVHIAEVLLQARASATQTAQGRWTPLMRAAQDCACTLAPRCFGAASVNSWGRNHS